MGRILACAGVVLLGFGSLVAGARGQTRKPVGDEWNQVRPLFKLVEGAAAGAPAPSDVEVVWLCHFLNADAGVVFVPFTLAFEPGAFTSFPVAMYVRVVARGAPAPAPGPADPLAQYPFEDAAMADRSTDGRISRGFTAPPGEYDVYLALMEKPAAHLPAPKTVVVRRAITVPELGPGLNVSSVIVLENIEIDPRPRRPDFEQQLDEPYALWGTLIVPALRSTFRRHESLSVTFLVYNAQPAGSDKPDVEVEYAFSRRAGDATSLITRTRPELFNGETLPPEFSLSRGDLIVAGQQVPLASFADGDYKLDISVTDKTNGTSLSRFVEFTVAGS